MSTGYHQGYPRAGGAPDRPPHTGIGARAVAALLMVVLAVAVVVTLNLVRVDQVAYEPGPVFDTLGTIDDTQVVTVEKEKTYPTEGRLMFTTIRVAGGPGDRMTAWEWLGARTQESVSLVPYDQVYAPDQTAEQVREQNTSLMQHSQEDAAVAALRELDVQVPEDVVVAQVIVDAPADGVLHVDDQILAVEGESMSDPAAVRDRLQEVDAGASATMRIVREGKERSVEVPTKKDEETGRTIVGVYLAPRYELPYTVSIDAGNVGGPSAGLMFSLAVYDKLTPGALTGGDTIAGTGTIDGDGAVGPIGGIKQKMYAADAAGAEVFLAPQGNCDEVVGNVPDGLTVVAVDSLDAAITQVEKVAGVHGEDLAGLDLPACAAG